MPYDQVLADRVREVLGPVRQVTEKRMFGGLAFMVKGHMALAVSSQGGLMLKCAAEETDRLLSKPHTRPMVMRGKELNGWIRVDDAGLRTKRQLETWVNRALESLSSR